jgi:hypothetical protein
VADRPLRGRGPFVPDRRARTTHELTAGSGPRERSLELLGLAALALRLRSRARTGNRREQIWRQGVYIGSVVLLAALAAAAWASVVTPGSGTSADQAPALIGAGALAGSVVLGMRGARWAAVLLACAGTAAVIGADSSQPGAGVLATMCIVAVAGVAAGSRPLPSTRAAALASGPASLAGLVPAVAFGADAATVAAVSSAIGAAALLGLGWCDPRLAAAAHAVIFSRLLATGLDELRLSQSWPRTAARLCSCGGPSCPRASRLLGSPRPARSAG